jgi:hypothetical protein
VAGGLVDSKEHWGGLVASLNPMNNGVVVAWLIPKSAGVAGDLVDSKQHWDRLVT